MLGAKYGFAQSMDCAVQTWIRTSRDNPWIRAYGHKVQIRGQSMDCAVQTTDCLVHSQVQSKVLNVSGVALPYDNNSNNINIINNYNNNNILPLPM